MHDKGHYREKVDGVFGLPTRASMRAYQTAENLQSLASLILFNSAHVSQNDERNHRPKETDLRAHFRSFLGRDPVCNFVILSLRQDAPRHHFTGFVIGTPCNHPVRFCRGYAPQAQQLLFCGSVQIEWLVAAPALPYPCRHSFRIVLYLRRCLRGFLLCAG